MRGTQRPTSIEAAIIVPGLPQKVAATARIVEEARRDGDIALLLAGKPKTQVPDPFLAEHP